MATNSTLPIKQKMYALKYLVLVCFFSFQGMATHFMLQMNGNSFELYQKRIKELNAVLEKLTTFCQVGQLVLHYQV